MGNFRQFFLIEILFNCKRIWQILKVRISELKKFQSRMILGINVKRDLYFPVLALNYLIEKKSDF
jgi:hypothetical protein